MYSINKKDRRNLFRLEEVKDNWEKNKTLEKKGS